MSRTKVLTHVFVESAPDKLEEGKLYVSIPYANVLHKCCCGCGNEVVTPLSPADWKLTFDGETISLSPSIGNWSLKCQAHYWIERNQVRWAGRWSREQIEAGRASDQITRHQRLEENKRQIGSTPKSVSPTHPKSSLDSPSWFDRLRNWWRK